MEYPGQGGWFLEATGVVPRFRWKDGAEEGGRVACVDEGAPLQITAALPPPGSDGPSAPTLGLSRSLLRQGPRQTLGFGNA